MAPSYKFSIISFCPDSVRGESLNIGIAILRDNAVEVKLTTKLEKLRAISAGIDFDHIKSIEQALIDVDNATRSAGITNAAARHQAISHVGPFRCSALGTFIADSEKAYVSRIYDLIAKMVDTEPLRYKIRKPKRTRLFSQLKAELKSRFILAKDAEGLESHRLVPAYEIDQGLVADLVLKNGSFHVIETIDASSELEGLRKAISDVAVSALVLERARMAFGEAQTQSKIIYSMSSHLESLIKPSLDAASNQGAELINWESNADRKNFLSHISSLATPSDKKQDRNVSFAHIRNVH
jgi:Protein of unknown function (DUF3037)